MEDVTFKRIVIGGLAIAGIVFVLQYPLVSFFVLGVTAIVYYLFSRRSSITSPAYDVKERVPIPPSVREHVLNRAMDSCQRCGRFGKDIHHIDSDPSNNNTDNLIYLCPTCHDEADRGHPSKERLRQIAQNSYDQRRSTQ